MYNNSFLKIRLILKHWSIFSILYLPMNKIKIPIVNNRKYNNKMHVGLLFG